MREEFIKIPVMKITAPLYIHLAGTSYCDGSYKIVRPRSTLGCIEYILEGRGTVITQGKKYEVKKGDTYFLKPNDDQEYFSSSDNPLIKIWVNFSGPLVDPLTNAYNLKHSTVFHCDSKKYIEDIHNVLKNTALSVNEIEFECEIIFHKLLQFLSKNNLTTTLLPNEAGVLKDYIDRHVYSQINIEELSGLIFKSPAQTIRIFKKHFKVTPYEYHLNCRIEKAISLLESTNFSVKEIAYKLAFRDEHYFSNIFKKKTGKRPSDFRSLI